MADTVITQVFEQPPINKKEILRYAGITSDNADIQRSVDECIAEMLPLVTYRTCRREFPIRYDGDTVDLGFAKTRSVSVARYLENCVSVLVFGATIGIEADRLISRYSAVSPSRALIMQAVGAERIESLCDALCEQINKEKASAGLRLKTRFSPGYGDFELTAQKDIFSALDCSRKIGLTLNQSMSMSPSKSVTAIVGIAGEQNENN